MKKILILILALTAFSSAHTYLDIYNKISGKIVKSYTDESCKEYGEEKGRLALFDKDRLRSEDVWTKKLKMDGVIFDKKSKFLVVSCESTILGVYDPTLFSYSIQYEVKNRWE